jgi:hypothetical protein
MINEDIHNVGMMRAAQNSGREDISVSLLSSVRWKSDEISTWERETTYLGNNLERVGPAMARRPNSQKGREA